MYDFLVNGELVKAGSQEMAMRFWKVFNEGRPVLTCEYISEN